MGDKFSDITTEGNVNVWYANAGYSVFSYDKELQLLLTSLEESQEKYLESFLLRRLNNRAIYIGSGSFSVMEFSLELIPKSPATCFYISVLCWNSTQVIFCLLAPPEAQLELFRSELQNFCLAHLNNIKGIDPHVLHLEKPSIESELKIWPYYSIDFLSRTVKALKENIVFALQVALQPCRVEMSADMPVQLASDLKAFINAASIADLISISRSSIGMEPQSSVVLKADGSSKDLQCSFYCREWANKLLAKEPYSVATIKRILEAMKLKTIKDMNMLRRLLKQAETDHYALYSACTFLRLAGNSDILLSHALDDGESSQEVINVLQQYLCDSAANG